MPEPVRPRRQDIQNETLRQDVEQGNLRLDSANRVHLQTQIRTAEEEGDTAGVAFLRYSLAYSLDHQEPYDHAAAVNHIDAVLADYSLWPEAIMNRGIARIHTTDFSGAIDDFDSVEELLFPPGGALRTLPDQDANLIRGKLLIFRAQALSGRQQPGDTDLARTSLVRAETFLRASNDRRQAVFWLGQIEARIRQTVEETEDARIGQSISSPKAFVAGVLFGLIALIWIGCVAVNQEISSKDDSSSVNKANEDDKTKPTKTSPAQSTKSNKAPADRSTVKPQQTRTQSPASVPTGGQSGKSASQPGKKTR